MVERWVTSSEGKGIAARWRRHRCDVYTALIFEGETCRESFELDAIGETPEVALENVLAKWSANHPEWRVERRAFGPTDQAGISNDPTAN
jgi:hypothetical protein